jgi:hypothetical protein
MPLRPAQTTEKFLADSGESALSITRLTGGYVNVKTVITVD